MTDEEGEREEGLARMRSKSRSLHEADAQLATRKRVWRALMLRAASVYLQTAHT